MTPARGTLTILVGAPGGASPKGSRRLTFGSTTLLAFVSARDAIRSALELRAHGVGVHAGEVTVDDGAAEGRAVAVAARIASLARPGEALVSSLTRELADDNLLTFGQPRELEDGLVVYPVDPVTQPLRLVVADDAAIIRDGLAAVLHATGHVVIGTACDGDTLLTLVDRHQPDIAIVDIRMPPTHTDEGLVAIEQIRARHPDVGVLVLSQYAEPTLALRLLNAAPAGGAGYLLKDRVSNIELLLDALRRIAAGETVIDPAVGERVLHSGNLGELTERELDVLRLIAQGRSNRAIAEQSFVTLKTVESHIRQIFLKLDLRETGDEHRRVAAVLAYLGHRSP
jgi:DNA-binding NarL/FixJ family response regulator